jgi:hypothetical protein
MIFFKNKPHKYYKLYFETFIVLIAVFLCSLFYTLPFFLDLSTDIGYYYLGASLLDENFILYRNWFDHKGPLIYLILNGLNSIIGLGVFQIFVFIIILFSVYILISNLIINKNLNLSYENIFVFIFCSSIFYIQDFNYTISIIQYFFIIISLYNFLEKNFILSISFLALSVLTRIDSIIYVIPLIFYFFYVQNYNFYKTLNFLLKILLIFFLFLFFISLILNFELNNYFITNFIWNFNTYQNLDSLSSDINKEKIFDFFNRFRLFAINFFYEIDFSKKFHLLYSYLIILFYLIIKRKKYVNLSKDETLFLFLICFFGFLLFFLSKSIKSYHIMNLYFPLYFSIMYLIKKNKNILKDKFFIFIILMLLLNPIIQGIKVLNDNCLNYIENCNSMVANNEKLIEYLKEEKKSKVNIIFDEPYFFIESKIKPNLGYANFIVFRDNNIKTNIHEKIKKNFYNLKKNDTIILPKGFHHSLHKSYANVLKNKIEMIKSFENYILYNVNENLSAR